MPIVCVLLGLASTCRGWPVFHQTSGLPEVAEFVTLTPALAPERSRSARTTLDAYRIFIAGVAVAAWAPLVPFAKARTDLNEGGLGLLLLCLGAGSIVAMPLAGALVSWFGCRRVLVGTTGS